MKKRWLWVSSGMLLGVFLLVPQLSHAEGVPFTIDLEYGMRDSAEVRQLQDFLRTYEYFDHVTTGNFLSVTFAGVKAWQTAHCVPSTGYFGPISRRAAALGTLCADPGESTTSEGTSDSSRVTIDGKAYIQTTNGLVAIRGGAPRRGDSAPGISVSVSPSSALLNPFATTTLSASVANATDAAVTWSASGGAIDSSGIFTAPSPNATTTYTITATSVADGTRSGTASITVVPITISVSSVASTPGGSTANFTALVANAATSTVTWSASGGSISSGGIFSAPAVTATTTYVITASSAIDSARARSASIEVTPNASFVGWWKVDEGASTTAFDLSGNGNHGTWSGTQIGDAGYYDTDAAPGFAYAGTFNGVDDLVTIPNINIGSVQTISFWAYIPSLVGQKELVSKSSSAQGVEFLIYDNTMTFYVMGSTVTRAAADPSDIRLGDWNYITGTYSGPNTTVTLYINGEQSGSITTAPSTIGDVTNLYFGNWTSGGRWFDGKLNDVRMYTTEFSAQQVRDLYDSLR